MIRGKLNKASLKKILRRSSFFLLSVIVFVVGSVSYAKYLSANNMDDASGIAHMGVEIFELEKYGSYAANIDYTQAVPGADIPGPRISLKLESEVSFTVYLRVTEGAGKDAVRLSTQDKRYERGNVIKGQDADGMSHDVVAYTLAPWWTYRGTMDSYKNEEDGMVYNVKLYQYNLAADSTHKENYVSDNATDHVFKPATLYNYTNDGEDTIQILEFDSIIISQYYGVRTNPPKFYFSFEAYIRQTVDVK